jgi:large subunit ribosomal protein L21
MYAVIETGGKQYRVEVGTELQVELLDVEPGKTITLERVLLVADGDNASIGRPLVADAEVSAEVVRQIRGEKVISFKYRPKARSRVKKGHRQELTFLRISDITFGGRSAAKDAAKAEREAKSERQHLEEAAAAQAAKDAELAAKLAATAEAAAPEASPKKADTKTTATADRQAAGARPTPRLQPRPRRQDPGGQEAAVGSRRRYQSTKASPAKADAADAKPAARSGPAPRRDEQTMGPQKAGGSVKNGRTAPVSVRRRPATASSSRPADHVRQG